MKAIINGVVAIICVVLGAGGAHFLKSTGGGSKGDTGHHQVSDDSHGGGHDDHKSGGGHSSSGHGGGDSHARGKDHGGGGYGGSNNPTYFKFSREFIVPHVENGRINSLVILNISLEIDSSVSDKVFQLEPAMRDNIMTTLIELSNDGRTFQSLTTVESYETLRATVKSRLTRVIPEGVDNVLILDIAQQDL